MPDSLKVYEGVLRARDRLEEGYRRKEYHSMPVLRGDLTSASCGWHQVMFKRMLDAPTIYCFLPRKSPK